jgi:hypothetical protein
MSSLATSVEDTGAAAVVAFAGLVGFSSEGADAAAGIEVTSAMLALC